MTLEDRIAQISRGIGLHADRDRYTSHTVRVDYRDHAPAWRASFLRGGSDEPVAFADAQSPDEALDRLVAEIEERNTFDRDVFDRNARAIAVRCCPS